MTTDGLSIGFSVFHGGKLIREVSFDRPTINIGKLSTANLRLSDKNASRKHAVIERQADGTWHLRDLESTNGTSLNGQPVQSKALKDGDRILIGATTIVVRLADGSARVASEPGSAQEIEGLGAETFYAVSEDDDLSDKLALEVALLWGDTILTLQHFEEPTQILVGEQEGCQLMLPEEVLGVPVYPLIQEVDGRFGLNLALKRIQGDVLLDGSVLPVGDLEKDGKLSAKHFILEEGTRARLRFGEFIILVSYTRMPKKPAISPFGSVDYNPFISIALSAILHIALLLFLSLQPQTQLISKADRDARRLKMIQVLKVQEPEEEEEEEIEEEPEDLKAKDKEEDDDEKKSELVDKLNEKKEVKKELDSLSKEDRKEKIKEMVQDTAMAQAFEDSAFTDLMQDSDEPQVDERLMQLGSRSDDPTDAAASSLDPFSGTLGPAAASNAFANTASVGGTSGKGQVISALGDKQKRGLDKLKFKQREVKPVAIARTASVTGRLDRSTVQRVIRQNLSGIKWCYQDALQRNRNLKGKVTLAFTILPNGRVANPSARNAQINDGKLLACIRGRMKRWKFPAPKEGGVVKVSYPLILKTR